MLKNFVNFTFELIKIVVISLAIIIPVRYYLIQPFYVKGSSMVPSFYDQEYLIINEITYRFNDPKRGDVIVFRYPRDPQEYYIKRVIGLPGEEVQVKDGYIWVYNSEYPDGIKLNEDYLPEGLKTFASSEERVAVEEGEYFVLGDNRNSSKDSRSFGPVAESFVIGKVMLRGWPFTRLDYFGETVYQY